MGAYIYKVENFQGSLRIQSASAGCIQLLSVGPQWGTVWHLV